MVQQTAKTSSKVKPVAGSTPMIKLTLLKSAIRRQEYQSVCLKGLGLRKLHSTSLIQDTPSNRGLIEKVKHLLHVEEYKG